MSPWIRRCDAAATVLLLVGLALAWLGRAGVALDLATTPASFADFVLVPLALIFCTAGSGRTLRPRWLTGGILCFATVGLVSGIANDLTMSQVSVGLMLYLEPFVAVFVLTNSSVPWLRTAILWTVGGILAAQVPFMVGQWVLLGAGDPVQGTLVGAGAGAHVLGSGLLLGAAILLSTSRRFHPAVLALVCAAIGGMVLADAKQVWALIPVVLVVMFVKRSLENHPHRTHRKPAGRRIVAGFLLLAVLAVPITMLIANSYVGNIISLTAENRGGKVAVAEALVEDVTSSPRTTLVGLGPGETVSRLAWMLSPPGGVDDSPLATLGLTASDQALKYHEAALSQGYVGESSVSYPLSSVLGIGGDYGLAGCVAYGVLFGGVLVSLWKSHDPLAAPTLAVWVSLLALGLISDWLEQTTITLMLAAVTAMALRGIPVHVEEPALADDRLGVS